MANPFNSNLLLFKETVSPLHAAYDYDVVDPESGKVLMECREENLKRSTKIFRFSGFKTATPFDIRAVSMGGTPVLRVSRKVPVLVSRVRVFDGNDEPIGGFNQKPFSISGSFDVVDAAGGSVCRLKGGLTGWSYRFIADTDVELARVTKKWAGLGKELLTSADDFMLEIDETVPPDSTVRQLIFASVICIGLVLKIEML